MKEIDRVAKVCLCCVLWVRGRAWLLLWLFDLVPVVPQTSHMPAERSRPQQLQNLCNIRRGSHVRLISREGESATETTDW